VKFVTSTKPITCSDKLRSGRHFAVVALFIVRAAVVKSLVVALTWQTTVKLVVSGQTAAESRRYELRS